MDFCEGLGTAMQHFHTKGAFLTVADGERVNTMTVSWGFIGFIWTKPHFITVVRPQRYTQELLEKADTFTISIPYGTMQAELGICGSKSGREIDKAEVVKFAKAQSVDGSIVDGCNMYYECRVTCVDQMDEAVLPPIIREKYYNDDYHMVYVGEIVNCYQK